METDGDLAAADQFCAGHKVWAKYMNFPYWPAEIVDTRSPLVPPAVLAQKKKNCVLVVFYGDHSYGWIPWKKKGKILPLSEEYSAQFFKKGDAKLQEALEEARTMQIYTPMSEAEMDALRREMKAEMKKEAKSLKKGKGGKNVGAGGSKSRKGDKRGATDVDEYSSGEEEEGEKVQSRGNGSFKQKKEKKREKRDSSAAPPIKRIKVEKSKKNEAPAFLVLAEKLKALLPVEFGNVDEVDKSRVSSVLKKMLSCTPSVQSLFESQAGKVLNDFRRALQSSTSGEDEKEASQLRKLIRRNLTKWRDIARESGVQPSTSQNSLASSTPASPSDSTETPVASSTTTSVVTETVEVENGEGDAMVVEESMVVEEKVESSAMEPDCSNSNEMESGGVQSMEVENSGNISSEATPPSSAPAANSSTPLRTTSFMSLDSASDDVYELVSEQCSAEDYKHVGPVDDRLRNSMRQILTKGWIESGKLDKSVCSVDPDFTVQCIETCVRDRLSQDEDYKKHILMLKTGLTQNLPLLHQVFEWKLDPFSVAGMSAYDLKTPEEKARHQQKKANAAEARQTSIVGRCKTTSIRCPKCGARNATFHEKQTRSADEPMTVFLECLECGKHWRR